MLVDVAIDPGVHGCGVSVWYENNLVHAEYAKGHGSQVHPLMEVIPGVVKALEGMEIDTLLIEKPKVYDTAHQIGDQRDLINLSIVVGEILYALAPQTKAALLVEPWEWKNQTPKHISEKRTRKALLAEETKMVVLPSAKSLHHNVWDAVGIGLWRFGGHRT